jgi:hypothetical protein
VLHLLAVNLVTLTLGNPYLTETSLLPHSLFLGWLNTKAGTSVFPEHVGNSKTNSTNFYGTTLFKTGWDQSSKNQSTSIVLSEY